MLTFEDQHRYEPDWPWPSSSDISESDLQILYYLGSTKKVANQSGCMGIQAFPFEKIP